MIAGVKVLFLARQDVTQVGSNSGNVYYTVDYDDVNPGLINDILQYQGHKIVRGDRSFSVFLKPHFAVGVYSGGSVFNAYGNRTGWIDCNSPSTPHFGLKLAWSATSAVCTYDVTTMYYLRFKNVR